MLLDTMARRLRWTRSRRWLAACAAALVIANVLLSFMAFILWQVSVPRNLDSAVLDQLEQLAAMPDKSQTALYIPRDHPYWQLLREDNRSCGTTPFVAPAITGLALINGLPAADCESAVDYGYHNYVRRSELPCVTARRYGLRRILVLKDVTGIREVLC